jgi:hypothetical protein
MKENKPTILIYDALTGEEITREMTSDEIAAVLNPLPDYLPAASENTNE